MAEKTTNFGLTKPSSEEFYDVNVQNENMDIIDEKLKEAFESGGGGTPEEIGAMSCKKIKDVENFTTVLEAVFSFEGSGTFFALANSALSLAADSPYYGNEIHYLVLSDDKNRKRVIAFHYFNDYGFAHMYTRTAYMNAWQQDKWYKLSDEFLPLTGGRLSGNLSIKSTDINGRIRLAHDYNHRASLYCYEDENYSNYTSLMLLNKKGLSNIQDAVSFYSVENNVGTSYKIFGEHNKDVLRNTLFTASTTDLTAGTSSLESGKIYLVYE